MQEKQTVSLRERVKSPPAQTLVQSYYKPAVEAGIKYLFDHEVNIHLAHTLMLERQDIIDPDSATKILKALLDLKEKGADALNIDYLQEDLYSYVESYIIAQLGPDTGGRMHTGRSRNDLNTTSWRMALREKLIALMEHLNTLRLTVLAQAERNVDTIMPGYTHSQHAQPISLGYYLLSFADLLGRDYIRVRSALHSSNCCPLGSGALSTTGFPIDRAYTSQLLGFPRLVEVGYDGVASRDDAHEASAALAVLMTGISRLATDLQNWNTMEYGMIELPDEYSSVSSIMPQKKNPQALEHVKGSVAYVTGALVTVLACSKNTAFADVNDGVTALNVPVMDAISKTSLASEIMAGVLKTIKINHERMDHLAQIGFGTATELTDVIVRETGLSFRKAHNIVGTVVREAIESSRTALSISSADLDAAAQKLFGIALNIDAQVVEQSLSPQSNIQLRTVTGGPAPGNMADMIAQRKKALEMDVSALASLRATLAQTNSQLLEMANAAANRHVSVAENIQHGG